MMNEFSQWMLTPKFKINVIRCNEEIAIQVKYGNLKEPTECVHLCFTPINDPDDLALHLESLLNSLLRSFNNPIQEYQNAIKESCD